MAAYTVEFVRSARKEFERLPPRMRGKIAEAFGCLPKTLYSITGR